MTDPVADSPPPAAEASPAGAPAAGGLSGLVASARLRWLLLVPLAYLLLFWQLGRHGLMETTEARYTEISAEMAESGDWLIPRMNQIAHLHKPPLTYWLVGASLRLFGRSEWAARLPSAVVIVLLVLLTGRCARRLYGPGAGWFASLITLTTAGAIGFARSVTTDVFLACLVLLALDAAWAVRAGARRAAWLYFLALGLGFLTKGPVVLLLALLPLLVSAAALRERGWLKRLLWHPGWLLFAAVGLSWYLVLVLRSPDLLRYWLVHHTVERVLDPAAFGRAGPWHEPLGALFGEFFPWTFFGLAALGAALRPRALRGLFKWGRHSCLPVADKNVGPTPESDDAAAREFHLAVWILLPLVAFCLIASKLPSYVLPQLPLLALLVAGQLAAAARAPAAARTPFVAWSAGLTAALFLAGGIYLADIFDQVRVLTPKNSAWLSAAAPALGGLLLACGLGLVLAARRRRWRLAAGLLALPLAGTLLLAYAPFAADIEDRHTARNSARYIRSEQHPGDRVAEFGDHLIALPFYLGARYVTVGFGREVEYTGFGGRAVPLEPPAKLAGWYYPEPKALAEFLAPAVPPGSAAPGAPAPRLFVVLARRFLDVARSDQQRPAVCANQAEEHTWDCVPVLRELLKDGRLRVGHETLRWAVLEGRLASQLTH